jgi:hypothetical protein
VSGKRNGRQRQDEHAREAERQRAQMREQQKTQKEQGTEQSPPPYEVPETPLERLDLGLAYLAGVIGGGFLLNFLVIVVIAGANGG